MRALHIEQADTIKEWVSSLSLQTICDSSEKESFWLGREDRQKTYIEKIKSCIAEADRIETFDRRHFEHEGNELLLASDGSKIGKSVTAGVVGPIQTAWRIKAPAAEVLHGEVAGLAISVLTDEHLRDVHVREDIPTTKIQSTSLA